MSKYYPVDLHVHTPASKCYRGGFGEEEYISIVRNYAKHNVRIIAFTDHNTIKGYKEYVRTYDQLSRDIQTLSEFEDSNELIAMKLNSLREIKRDLDSVLVLPGVEFEATPGIHLLFVFNPSQDLSLVERFLEDGGYSDSDQGVENPTANVRWDVLEALQRAKDIDAITIAAHVDSNKGIYNDLHGTYRARVFKSENLDALSVNSVVNIDKIVSLLEQNEYKRSSPIAFIQSSDHHNQADCAKMLTYVCLEKISFACLVDAFRNPDVNISPTADPETRSIINRFANSKKIINIESHTSTEAILKAACAILNDGYGGILIGVTSDSYKNTRGVSSTLDDINSICMLFKDKLTPGSLFYEYEIQSWEWGQKKVYLIELHNNSFQQFFYEGRHLHLENKKPVDSDPAFLSNSDNGGTNTIKRLNERLFENIGALREKLALLYEEKFALPIIKSIEAKGVLLSSIVQLNIEDFELDVDTEDLLPFGGSQGNVYLMPTYESIRSSDYYVRITPYRLSVLSLFEKEKSFSGPGIALCPGGASYYIADSSCVIYNRKGTSLPYLYFTLRYNYSTLSIIPIIAWIKSSVFLWYMNIAFGSEDLYKPTVFNKVLRSNLNSAYR